ncbi:MAG TPA: globin domain-containing protein [Tepidisphaeraceae bacterium]|jgi:nitric oxide dioxygenase
MKLSAHPLAPELNLPRVAPDRSLAQRLRESYQVLSPQGEMLAERFYTRLFWAQPTLRKLFYGDMASQRQKMLGMLQWIVANLEDRATLKAGLVALGQRHRAYGARPEHYPVVAEQLIAAMAEVAGPAWDEQIAGDWRTALERIGATMLGEP